MAPVLHTAEELKPYAGCIIIPTMGALHEGHLKLIEKAKDAAHQRAGAHVVVSIYVNPKQFNEETDFTSYPRALHEDVDKAHAAGADAIFAPDDDTIYPPDETLDEPALPDVARTPGLEDAYRPGHFKGVCLVVDRLFELTNPAAAIFGEKDWQQLQVVRAMTKARRPHMNIIPCETVREEGGLAMSSRNQLLDAEARTSALAIARALRLARESSEPSQAESIMRRTLEEAGLDIDYAVVRDAQSLLPLTGDESRSSEGARALIAARAAGVRLIDNDIWP